MPRLLLFLLFALLGCQDGGSRGPVLLDTADTGLPRDTADTDAVDDGPLGFIGSPCTGDADCAYTGGVCLTDGYDRGMCSAACDRYCDDMDGHPTTFCVDGAQLSGQAADLGAGACHSRCDFSVFPSSGCRPGYGCVVEDRANEPGTQTWVCMPGRQTELSQCYLDLAARGVAFEPTVMQPEHPSGYPNLTCTVQDPLFIEPPVLGVDLTYYDGTPTPRIRAACEMAQALTDTVEDVKAQGVVAIRHIGTYNCRPIAGTTTLSQHAYANAIDLYGFEFDDGSYYTLIDDWEKDTTDPATDAGQWLYDAAYRWHDEHLWNIILTPNYNSAHANHFHVDLTPHADYIGADGPFQVRPMDGDCGGPGIQDHYVP